jgi:geranylgeranyl pyrophosphate synthase
MLRELAHATGPQGMIGGQVLDMAAENHALALEQLQDVHRRKTGALITASCRLGALAAAAPDSHLEALTRFGQHLGLAFQITDDLLDVTSTEHQLGKGTRKDARKGKNTYPALLGLDESRHVARFQVHQAVTALSALGQSARDLAELARFVLSRGS